MRVNAALWWVLSLFFGIAAVAYAVWTLIEYGDVPEGEFKQSGVEWVGTVALSLTSVLGIFLGFYLGRAHKAQGGELPEDLGDADIDDGDPEIGHFSPWSWWPLALGAGAAIVALGLAVGMWILFIGAAFTVIALIGWQYEYYRGNFGR
jgi:amino acid transporter